MNKKNYFGIIIAIIIIFGILLFRLDVKKMVQAPKKIPEIQLIVDEALFKATGTFIQGDSLFIPLTPFAKQFNIKVERKDKKVVLSKKDKRVELELGDTQVLLNQKKIQLPGKVVEKKGEIFVPIRLLAQMLQASVSWDPASRIAHFRQSRK